jgi:hypothetical protein
MTQVKLLSGDNPQIAKADGDAPVQAWIAAIPGWKSPAAAQLDRLVEQVVPGVKKAVKWNSPLYGVEGQGWFMGLHGFKNYLKLNFFFGQQLTPLPPVGSKDPNARYVHITEAGIDQDQLADWLKQAAAGPLWKI